MEDGAFISARGLASELNISFTPVRDALLRLANEGYLKRVPSVGFFKTPANINNIQDYWESRVMIEHFIMPMVVQKITKDDLLHLREIAKKLEVSFAEKAIVEYGEQDIEFHAYLIDLHGNKQISQFYRNIREQNRTYSRQNFFMGVTVREHSDFLNYVEKKDFDKALDVIFESLRQYMDRMRRGSVRI
ncbi:MAG: GntR family transcriptional regulator [Planctomycetaceae bacterium]|nr:GntR family transcriptional regulator [Planctomycetaceae bacterium]